jgi:prepilin-type N-terminal cleavage/methylation domain-containing protein
MFKWLEKIKRDLLERHARALQSAPEDGEAGFTLIEMSIVLVIIGLIIGGVLKGQELINSTRIKATVSQWDASKAAINGFIDKFRALPGDYNDANTVISATGVLNGGTAGLGNGQVGTLFTANNGGGNTAYANNVAGTTDESLNAWAHLGAAGLISGITVSSTGGALTAAGSGGVMTGKISGTSWAIVHATINGQTSLWGRLQGGTGAPTAAVSAKDAAEIDRKFDDNSAITGTIMAAPLGATAGTDCATTGGVYHALNVTNVCVVAMNLQ